MNKHVCNIPRVHSALSRIIPRGNHGEMRWNWYDFDLFDSVEHGSWSKISGIVFELVRKDGGSAADNMPR